MESSGANPPIYPSLSRAEASYQDPPLLMGEKVVPHRMRSPRHPLFRCSRLSSLSRACRPFRARPSTLQDSISGASNSTRTVQESEECLSEYGRIPSILYRVGNSNQYATWLHTIYAMGHKNEKVARADTVPARINRYMYSRPSILATWANSAIFFCSGVGMRTSCVSCRKGERCIDCGSTSSDDEGCGYMGMCLINIMRF